MFKVLSIELYIKSSLNFHCASLNCVKHTYIYMHFDCFCFSILSTVYKRISCYVLHALDRGLVKEEYRNISKYWDR